MLRFLVFCQAWRVILLEYKYKPDDYEAKLVLIYSLSNLKKNPSYAILSQVVSSGVDIQYFEMQEYLHALIDMKSVEEIQEGDEFVYSLTPLGEESCEFFSNRIPASVREKIENAAASVNNDRTDQNRVYADYIPINENEYKIECGIMENNLKLLDFEMYAGSKEKAKKMCACFKEHTDEFYVHVIKFFDDNSNKDE
ncbi:MAG: DUF4364 family protein [Clostridia bacterium]|nr:DUF4364 family protein [Clostridia bacterium]